MNNLLLSDYCCVLIQEAFAKPFFCLMTSFSSVRAEGMPLAQSSLIANKLRFRTAAGFDINPNPLIFKALFKRVL
jgi:hypothetical protein